MKNNAEGGFRYDYGKVMAIFMGCVYAYTIFITFWGPENLGADMSVHGNEGPEGRGAAKTDSEWAAAGSDDANSQDAKREVHEKEIAG